MHSVYRAVIAVKHVRSKMPVLVGQTGRLLPARVKACAHEAQDFTCPQGTKAMPER